MSRTGTAPSVLNVMTPIGQFPGAHRMPSFLMSACMYWNPTLTGGSTATSSRLRWSTDTFLQSWTYDNRVDSGFFAFSTPQEDLGDIGSVVWEVREGDGRHVWALVQRPNSASTWPEKSMWTNWYRVTRPGRR